MFTTLARVTLTVLLVTLAVLPSYGNWYGKREDKDDAFSAILQAAQAPSRRHLIDTLRSADFDTDAAIESALGMARRDEESKRFRFATR